MAGRALAEIRPAMSIEGHELHVTASIGISLFPFDGEDPETLIKNADVALYRAKSLGGDTYQIYTPEMNELALERLMLENELRRAVGEEVFELSYQPQVAVAGGDWIGAEALLRWPRRGGEVMMPDDFVPVAEETGQIVALGGWVLRQACGEIERWRRDDGPSLPVSVNLSARQLRQNGLVESVQQALETSGVPPSLLELELTESSILDNPQAGIEVLHALRDLGVGVAIDDFGTGYSSLSYLKQLPITALKIDRSFIAGCATDAADGAIVAAMISMGHSLGLRVVAEGVEADEQLDFLQRHGCDAMQGFLIGRPVSGKHFARQLREQRAMRFEVGLG